MVCVDFSGLCLSRQGCRIHFLGGGTYMEDSVTLNDTVILRAIVNSLMYTPNPMCGGGGSWYSSCSQSF
jgi:hypothetical protein